MNKKTHRLLRPGLGVYFIVMLGFCLVALLMDLPVLAGVEGAITAALYASYLLLRKLRHRELLRFLQKNPETVESTGKGSSPFPTLAVRISDGSIVWANDEFTKITGFSDLLTEQFLSDILPDLSTDWLSAQKTEAPYDITIHARRYRVYGTMVKADDQFGTPLGVFYFSDLTSLYQIRDEYVRSRPVVSIILIDNYEELTKNLSESAISTMNAKLNTAITEWTEPYHGILRKLERNRFLFIFEKKDLNHAIEDKFSLLETIHHITNPSGLAASLSIGLGVDAVNS